MAADDDHHPPSDHFFKFIPPGFKFNLSLPKSFSRNLNNARLKKATLRRGGREWLVDISDDGVFDDGWRKLVIENGVQDFDFIVFKHQGNMVFDFLVFDQSTCERQYPNLSDEMDVEEPLTESDSTHTENCLLERLPKRKKNDYLSIKEDKSQVDDDHFVIIMTPYQIKSSRLHVPLKFARSHGLTNRIHTQIALVDEAQRTWPATLKIMSSEARLTGWAKFNINNHLKAGDVCMFKIVKLGEVPIFNFYKLRKKPIKNLIQVKKESILKTTRSTQKDHRYFISTIKSYFKKSGLYLPAKFSRLNGLKAGEMVIRDDKGRSWKVEVQKSGEKCLYVGGGGGFKYFCMENGLREGDVFKLELVENKKNKPPIANFSLIVDEEANSQEVDRRSTTRTSNRRN